MSVITIDHFSDKRGQAFEMVFDDGVLPLTLTSVDSRPTVEFAGRTREPFSLLFEGTPGTLCPQGNYRIRHASGLETVVFLVPIADGQNGAYVYQAVYN